MIKTLQTTLGRHGDLVIVALVLAVLVVLFVPIPSVLLDLLILTNFGFAFLILLLTFYMARPVEFSTFPSLLLIATLFRLSLNVAATRLILSSADAGRVIGAIGSYVVGGNYVIGLIVFLILIVVQYVVVTNGAQRVSEVAARFTLDSMPGQQMSIDADLNMGFIDQAEAQRRRRMLEKEAGFYGAMDGASKFVKGDAIAGIIILLVNIVGGLAIGVMQLEMPWGEALRTYTLLTIGDGIVTQVPALVISVGTGIIVTRSASDGNLSREVLRQMTSFPKTLFLVVGALAGLALLPGIPALPALFLIGGLLLVGWRMRVAAQRAATADAAGASAAQGAAEAEDVYQSMAVDPIEVRLGANWIARIGVAGGGGDAGGGGGAGATDAAGVQADASLLDRVATFRKIHAQDLGQVLPTVRFKPGAHLEPNQYEILVDAVPVGRGEARLGQWLAIHPNGDTRAVKGEPTREPSYGLPAVWIAESERAAAQKANFTLIDPLTVLVTHITEVLRRESPGLLNRAEIERLLARVRTTQPALVEELIPTVLAVSDVQKVLQNLLREKVSIRNIEAILETLADAGRTTKDAETLTETVRGRLANAICQSLVADAGGRNVLNVLVLEPALEARFLQSVRASEGRQPVLEPRFAERFLGQLVQAAEVMMKSGLLPVLLCSPELRRHLRSMAERVLPQMRVLSMADIPQSIELKSWAVVNVANIANVANVANVTSVTNAVEAGAPA